MPLTQPLQEMRAAVPLDRRHFEYEATIKRLHNHLYGNANIRTPDGIANEVTKVLKVLIWRADRAIDHDPQVTEEPGITRRLFDRMNDDLEAYPAGEVVLLDDASLLAVLDHLAGIDFSLRDRDWIGDAVEIFRSLTAKRVGGQFFTHPFVTQLAMELLEFDPDHGDDLVDVCAGTAGFLLAGARCASSSGFNAEPQLRGIEVDPDLALFANANLKLQGIPSTGTVHEANSLASPEDWPTALRREIIPGTHQCLASNPPFGTKIRIKDVDILEQYDLARAWKKQGLNWETSGGRARPRSPDVLFIERNLQLAEPGKGRVALVTPYQVLSGPQAGFVREWLLRNARIRAVVDLPPTTFQPHTGTKTALLVLERREEVLNRSSDSESYPIFMAVTEHIGHDRRGNPVFEPHGDFVRSDLPSVAAAFSAFREGGDPAEAFDGAFVIDSHEISRESDLRINAAFHRPSTTAIRRRLEQRAARDDWTLATVGDVSSEIFFPPRFKRNYVDEGGVPFLSGTNISQVKPTGVKYLSPDNPRIDECIVSSGWILVTRSGSTGVVSSVPEAWDGFAVSDHVIRIIPDPKKVDPGYLQAYLRSSIGQSLLASGVFGSVIDEITPEHVASIPIPIPSEEADYEAVVQSMAAVEAARNVVAIELETVEERIRQLLTA